MDTPEEAFRIFLVKKKIRQNYGRSKSQHQEYISLLNNTVFDIYLYAKAKMTRLPNNKQEYT